MSLITNESASSKEDAGRLVREAILRRIAQLGNKRVPFIMDDEDAERNDCVDEELTFLHRLLDTFEDLINQYEVP